MVFDGEAQSVISNNSMSSSNHDTGGMRDRSHSFGTSLGQSGNLLAVMNGSLSSSRDISQAVEKFIYKLKRRQIYGSAQVAVETANLLRWIISNARFNNANSIMNLIREVGVKLVHAQPIELAVGNIVRRVLHIIREEYLEEDDYLDEEEDDDEEEEDDEEDDDEDLEDQGDQDYQGDQKTTIMEKAKADGGQHIISEEGKASTIYTRQNSIDVNRNSNNKNNSNVNNNVNVNVVLSASSSISTPITNGGAAAAAVVAVGNGGSNNPSGNPISSGNSNNIPLAPAVIKEKWTNPGNVVESSMYNMLAEPDKTLNDVDYSLPKSSLKSLVIQQLNEQLLDDLNNTHSKIAEESLKHIHSNEVIMTIGKSRTVQEFLKAAAKKRKFSVIVAETCPFYHGQETASVLAKEGIDTIVIPDASIFALMARVNKVILGTHAVTANGGLIAVTGSHMLALAAKHHATPVVVCTGLFKLSPLYPHDRDSFNLYVSPERCLSYENDDAVRDNVHSLQPYFDYVSPDLVNLFITNNGGHPPSYIYRLLGELYDSRDYNLI